MPNQFSVEPSAMPASVARQQDYDTPHKTVVVAGIPQGGTSVVAAIVDALGVPIAGGLYNFEPAHRPRCGDTLKGRAEKVTGVDLDVWGFKDTMIWRLSTKAAHDLLRNPYYIVVARDPIAVIQRRAANYELSEPKQMHDLLGLAVNESAALWEWMYELPPAPLLFVSYERALHNPFATCDAIALFLDLVPTLYQLQRAAARISVDGGYLTKEDIT